MLEILLFLVIVVLIFTFIYHEALVYAYREHGFFGVINMYLAIFIHRISKTITRD